MSKKDSKKDGIRQRKMTGREKSKNADEMNFQQNIDQNKEESEENEKRKCQIPPGSFWLTRIVILRYIGFIYFVAFLVALHQNKQLLGKDGLLPADKLLDDIKSRHNNNYWTMFNSIPSILWLFDYGVNLDVLLDGIAYAGLILSAFLVVRGAANWFIMIALWVFYHSLVNVGQTWYSFGWESQLLETGFLSIFLCPVWNLSTLPQHTPTSTIVIWAYRWLIFRIMLGATQPVPNPISYYMHQSPEVFHKFETLSNHFVELVVPFFLFLTRRIIMIGGILQIVFQVVLIISGNLSFLNWLTIVPSLACFDDLSLSWMFSKSTKQKVAQLELERRVKRSKDRLGSYIRRVFNISVGVLIIYLSIPVVQNLFSPRQAMNTSFEPLRLVNTYGAFGSVTKKRIEVIFEGTSSHDPHSSNAVWQEYEFKCKPGNVSRTPCLISPYHYRLDWLLWFVPFHKNFQYNPWIVHIMVKLLSNDVETLSLIQHNPFKDAPPRFIRIENYRYTYTKIGSREAREGKWWKRKHTGSYLQPISRDSVKDFMKNMGWKMPKLRKSKT